MTTEIDEIRQNLDHLKVFEDLLSERKRFFSVVFIKYGLGIGHVEQEVHDEFQQMHDVVEDRVLQVVDVTLHQKKHELLKNRLA